MQSFCVKWKGGVLTGHTQKGLIVSERHMPKHIPIRDKIGFKIFIKEALVL